MGEQEAQASDQPSLSNSRMGEQACKPPTSPPAPAGGGAQSSALRSTVFPAIFVFLKCSNFIPAELGNLMNKVHRQTILKHIEYILTPELSLPLLN